MSVDLVGTMRGAVRLDELVTTARETLGQLLGLTETPIIEVTAGRRYEQGRLVDRGHRLSADEMLSDVVDECERQSAGCLEFTTADGDGARLLVFEESLTTPDAVDACFSPHRTCVGVVVATALALAAARLGGGDFVDVEIMMLQPPVAQPDRVIQLTRLADSELDFAQRCESYLRQFTHLRGWPRDVRLTD
jgi:hypothetical protein